MRYLDGIQWRLARVTALSAAVLWGASAAHAQQCWPERYDLLMPAGLHEGDQYGHAMATAGDWLFVGAPFDDLVETDAGAVYAFEFVKGEPVLRQKIVASGGVGPAHFGWSIASDGQRLISGAENDRESPTPSTAWGAAYIFEFNGTHWVQKHKLLPFGPGNVRQLGWAVAIQDDLAVVGARVIVNDGVDGKGGAFVFEHDGKSWGAQQRLTSDSPITLDLFGSTIAIAEQTIIVGCPKENTQGFPGGAVFVFERIEETWTQLQKIHATLPGSRDFGIRVVADGPQLMIASTKSDISEGVVYGYQFDNGLWEHTGELLLPGEFVFGSNWGSALAFRGDTVAVGAPSANAPGNATPYLPVSSAGKVYVYQRLNKVWERRSVNLAQLVNRTGYGPIECWQFGPQPANWPQSLSNARLGTAVALGPNQIYASTTSSVRPCCWGFQGLDNTGSVNVFARESLISDCNANGVQDECDAESDCNGNYVPDSCDLAKATSDDCNINAIPDECEMGARYQLENEGFSFMYWDPAAPTVNADFIWLNQFRVKPGGQVITHIILPSSQYLPHGASMKVLLYGDPNGDGNPTDAVLLASAVTDTVSYAPQLEYRFVPVPISPTKVGEVGDSFFVAAVVQPPFLAGAKPWRVAAARSGASNLMRSWRAFAPPGQADIHDLTNNASPIQLWENGPFVLRAIAADCNNNGVWDACDIANDARLDLNTNGIIDACEQSNCIFADVAPSGGDNQVGVPDLLTVISNWGVCTPCFAICPGDVNDDCAVGVPDLLAVIGAWGPCP